MQDPTTYQETKNDQCLFEFLYIIYEDYWNKKWPEDSRAAVNPMTYEEMIQREKIGLYQMRCKNNFIAMQYDSCNCSLAVKLAIIRFVRAFNSTLVLKNGFLIMK